jgi:hypothetical protein
MTLGSVNEEWVLFTVTRAQPNKIKYTIETLEESTTDLVDALMHSYVLNDFKRLLNIYGGSFTLIGPCTTITIPVIHNTIKIYSIMMAKTPILQNSFIANLSKMEIEWKRD